MASTRDHVAAQDYESRRRVTSLLRGADEARRDPRRRLNRTLVGSAVIAVLVMAGVGVAGWLGAGRGPDLPDSGAVVVEGTGERYVVIDGVVHPALNLASALLVGGSELTEVRREALDGQPRGLPVGIPNVPDALPPAKRQSTNPWTVCLLPSGSQVVAPTVTVLVDLPAPTTGTLRQNDAVVATDGTDTQWLVADGRRYRLEGIARSALGLQRATDFPLLPKVLDTIPEGPPVTVPDVPTGGAPDVDLPVDAAVGDLIESPVPGQRANHFVVRPDGVSPLSEFGYALLLASGRPTRHADPASMANVPESAQPAPEPAGWPEVVPTARGVERGQPLCVSTDPTQPGGDAPWAVTVSLPPSTPAPDGIPPVRSQTGDLPGAVTNVVIEPGSVTLVLASSSAGEDGTYTLVTDSGQRFPIASADAVSRLRYDPDLAVPLPHQFTDLLPAGPVLDPDAAAREVPGTAD